MTDTGRFRNEHFQTACAAVPRGTALGRVATETMQQVSGPRETCYETVTPQAVDRCSCISCGRHVCLGGPAIVDALNFGHSARHLTDLGLPAQGSEEHTSELQSLMRISYAVFCLKKKKTNTK